MSPRDLIVTSLLLGAFVAAGGTYGVLLSLEYALHKPGWHRFAIAAYCVQLALTAALLTLTPLSWWWKLLLAVSSVGYYFIPPLTWRYLIRLHKAGEAST